MSAHRVLYDLQKAPFRISDPGDGETITITRYGAVCLLESSASNETRTLAQPTKAGLSCKLVHETDGGGYITVTVTGGYDINDQTTFILDTAGQWIEFTSVDIGGSYYWRVVQREGATRVPDEHGAGAVGTGVAPQTHRWTEKNGDIITEIRVDLDGLKCKGDAAKDAIGLTGAAYIGRYVTATCGIVYRAEMICLEAPGEGTATITSDIDLGAEDADSTAYDGAVDDVVINTGGIAAGCTYVDDVPALTANDYLYLVEGDTTAATGVYNAGQVIVRLTGHPLLA